MLASHTVIFIWQYMSQTNTLYNLNCVILYVNYISIKKEKYVLNNVFKKLVLTYLDIESMTI